MIARIAVGLARNPSHEHRWRRVTVPVTSAIFMLLVLAATGVVTMAQRETGRAADRAATLASTPSPTDLFVVTRYDLWRGEQFSVVWIEPASPGTKPVLPPGMARLPEPGQAVVSPTLDRLASNNPNLAARYPNRLVLGEEGIRSGEELFAYVRTPGGRTLADEEQALRVSGFGPPTGVGRSFQSDMLSSVSIVPVSGGVLGFLVIPGLVVLAVGLTAASGVRDHRLEVLRYMGVPGRTLLALTVLETMVLAMPGLVASTVLWAAVGPLLGHVPLVGHKVVHGDLGLPWWLLALELGACTVVVCLVTMTTTTIRRLRDVARPRPGNRRAVVAPFRAVPLGIAIVAFALGRTASGNAAANLNLVGAIAAVIGVPLILPITLRALGALLSRLESVPASLAGRGMEWDPTRTARPFAGGAALIVLVLVGGGYVALARHVEAPPVLPTGSAQAVVVEWLDHRPDDPARLANAIGEGLIVPFGEGGHSHGHSHGHDGEHPHEGSQEGTLAVGATCSQLAPYFSGASCDPKAPFGLPTATERELAERLAVAAHGSNASIQLVPEEEVTNSGSVFVLDKAALEVLEERVRSAATRTLPAPSVYSWLASTMQESPLVPWILGGIVVAMVALAVGCLVSLVDRLLVMRKHRRYLLNLGIQSRRLTMLEAWLFAAPYSAIIAISFIVGLSICALMIAFSDIPMPWNLVGATLVVATVAGFIGTASVAFFGARSMNESPE